MRIEIGNKKIFSECLHQILKTSIDDSEFNGITFNSREVQRGDVFIAIPGQKADGHDYIQECLEKGTVLIINEMLIDEKMIKVESSKDMLGKLAKLYRDSMSCKVIGVTGSNGKTTTKELLVHILEGEYRTSYTKNNFNSTIGAPMSIFSIKEEDELFIAEIGTNRIGEIDYISKIVQPDIAVITNIAESHLLNFHTLEGIYKEKENIFKSLRKRGKAFINMDDPLIASENPSDDYETILYGSYENLDYSIKKEDENQNIIIINEQRIDIPNHINIHTQNILTAFSICSELGIEAEVFNNRLSSFKTPEGRGEFIAIKDFIVINDTYNANYSSVVSGLSMLKKMSEDNRIIVVLGDMLELGKDEKKLHTKLLKHISQNNFHQTFLYGALMHELYLENNEQASDTKIKHYNDQQKIISELKNILRANDIVYIKGSRGMKMENIIKGIA